VPVRGKGCSIGLVFACAWLALTASASAAPTWLPPTDIAGPTQSITFPEVAVNAAGDAIAIWPRNTGSEMVIESLERPAGGDWSEPVVLSDPDEEEPSNVHIGLDAAGNAVAVWSAFDTGFVIRTAARPAGEEWSAPEDLFVNGGRTPQLAMNAAGDAVAVWTGFNGTDEVTWASVRSAGGDWSAPEDLSVAGESDWLGPQVAIDAAGNAIAVWERLLTGDDVIRAAVRTAGGEWSAPDDLSVAGEDTGSPRIAMNAAGSAVAAWSLSGGGGVRAAVRPAGGDWSAPEEVSAAGVEPALAVDSGGNAFALWPGAGSTEQILRTAMRPQGGGWSAPEDLSAEFERFRSYDLDANAAVGVVATWTREGGIPNNGVQAAIRPPGGNWSEPEEISAEGEDSGLPDIGFDAVGNAVAIWGRDAGSDYMLQGAGYDFSGPRLDGLQIPATGTVGEPVSFVVSPFDVFSLGATSWTFGDGSQVANGNAVSHVYAAPGKYPVMVSAVDGSGNASTQTETITIAASPNPPPPPRPPVKIELSLRLGKASLDRLLRSGKLIAFATVNEPARVVLSGRVRLRVPRPGGPQVKRVAIFKQTAVQFAIAGERKVKLKLSRWGRTVLRDLNAIKVLIAGKATDAAGEVARDTLAQTLR
jgi:PKD domain-containing protein